MSPSSQQSSLHCHEIIGRSPFSSTDALNEQPPPAPASRPPSANQQQQPQRHYRLFHPLSNQLSTERKRLHQVTLLDCGERTIGAGGQRESAQQTTARAQPPLDTPKNAGKVLGLIDVNIPGNEARQSGRMNIGTGTVIVGSQQSAVSGSRKRRAISLEEQQELEQGRLNLKERVWVCADVDRTVHLDGRCLQNLLAAEKLVQVGELQIQRRQQSADQRMEAGGERGVNETDRANAIDWLQEVCEEEHADCVVLPLAVAYLDRVLASKFLPRRNLQALASACLLLASKLKAPQPISTGRMVIHSDSSVGVDELLDWEVLVLNHLQWALVQSTPFELFDQLLVRCPVLEALREDFALCLNRTQRVLRLATQLPSVQASACLLFCAMRSKRRHLLEESDRTIRRYLGLEPNSSLVPLFDDIAASLGLLQSTIATDVRNLQFVFGSQQIAIQPPISKRISLEPFHQSTTAEILQPNNLQMVGTEKASSQDELPVGTEQQKPAQKDIRPAVTTNSSSPPIHLLEDEASRSSSSSNDSSKTVGAGCGQRTFGNDSGFHSSSQSDLQLSPPAAGHSAHLMNRKAKDFGQLW